MSPINPGGVPPTWDMVWSSRDVHLAVALLLRSTKGSTERLGPAPGFENWPQMGKLEARIFPSSPSILIQKRWERCREVLASSSFWQPSVFNPGSVQDRGHRAAKFADLMEIQKSR